MLPSETMIWQPEFTDKTLSRKPGAVHIGEYYVPWQEFVNSVGKPFRQYAQNMAQIRLRVDTIQAAGPFTTVITAEEHIDCPSIILPSTSKLLVGLDLFNCVNRASQRKALMHHLTLKVTTSKMTFNGTMRFNVSLGRLFQYTKLSVVCVSCIKY